MIPKTILICDDHPLVRLALVGTVEGMFPASEIAEATCFPDAIALAPAADLCICDLVMPGAEPLEGVSALLEVLNKSPLLVVTGTNDDNLMVNLLRAGVSGFLQDCQ